MPPGEVSNNEFSRVVSTYTWVIAQFRDVFYIVPRWRAQL